MRPIMLVVNTVNSTSYAVREERKRRERERERRERKREDVAMAAERLRN